MAASRGSIGMRWATASGGRRPVERGLPETDGPRFGGPLRFEKVTTRPQKWRGLAGGRRRISKRGGRIPKVFGDFCLRIAAEEEAACFAKAGGVPNRLPPEYQGDLRAPPKEVVELDDHLSPRREFDFATQVLGPLNKHIRARGIGPNRLQQIKSLCAVAAPEARRKRLGGGRRRSCVEIHQTGLVEERVSDVVGRLAVPARLREGERDAKFLNDCSDFLADVQTIGELPTKDAHLLFGVIHFDDVLSRHLHPVGAGASLCAHRERANAATLGNDIGFRQWLVELETLIDILEHEPPILGSNYGLRVVDARVGGADTRAWPHGNHEKEPSVVCEERQHPLVGRESIDDEVNALRKHVLVVGLRPVFVFNASTKGPHAFSSTFAWIAKVSPVTVVEGASYEVPHEACVVVVENRLFLGDRAHRKQTRFLGEEISDKPIEPGTQRELPEAVAEPLFVHHVKADLADRRRVAPDQMVARHAELSHEGELEALHVLDAAPRQIDDCWLVNEAKSPRSTKATRAPRAERQAAATAPLMPPPTSSTSWVPCWSRATLVVRSDGAAGLREDNMAPTIDQNPAHRAPMDGTGANRSARRFALAFPPRNVPGGVANRLRLFDLPSAGPRADALPLRERRARPSTPGRLYRAAHQEKPWL
ncbi:hypothetical protein OUZ56_033169 [Daphnia magna]|uniref:Uncharacterized protein n=1 Tax=Daphnia magna TaxID=35525 RepID=A0ABR0BAD5_9CRUS|nr:hypothetical protein OUZ56_033169 [Daphnia magna]